ncbi:Uncharacterised protein [Mycobacteroides abscessus subsp. massiliense]|nr:Uncharacterised protein [Mycobacteroides abscessus subsp. massiliense]
MSSRIGSAKMPPAATCGYLPSLDSRKLSTSGNRASALPEPASGANALTTGVPLGKVDRNTEK